MSPCSLYFHRNTKLLIDYQPLSDNILFRYSFIHYCLYKEFFLLRSVCNLDTWMQLSLLDLKFNTWPLFSGWEFPFYYWFINSLNWQPQKMYNCKFHVSVKQHITVLLITLKPFYSYKGGSHPTALLCDTLPLSNQSTRKIIKTHV